MLYEVITPVKTALAEMGFMQEVFRAPLCTMVDENKQKLLNELKALSII